MCANDDGLCASCVLLQVVDGSPFLSHDELDACFPYDLVLSAYRASYQQELGTV